MIQLQNSKKERERNKKRERERKAKEIRGCQMMTRRLFFESVLKTLRYMLMQRQKKRF
jgi:hypothetical protein